MAEISHDEPFEEFLFLLFHWKDFKAHVGFDPAATWENFRASYDKDGHVDMDQVGEDLASFPPFVAAATEMITPEQILDGLLDVIESAKNSGNIEAMREAERLRDLALASGKIRKQ